MLYGIRIRSQILYDPKGERILLFNENKMSELAIKS